MRIDSYSFYARVSPVLIMIFPAVLAGIAWTPEGITLKSTAGGLGLSLALSFFVAQLGRDNGFKLQAKLWEKWGGAPTTQLLRHGGETNPILLKRYHKNLSELLGKTFPSAAAERRNPQEANLIYEAAVSELRKKTRDAKAYPLVYKELTNYGFRRNLLGCKPAGLLISLLAVVAISGAILQSANNDTLLLCATSVVFFVFWLLRVNSEWVKIPAFAYARVLLEAA